MGTALLTPTPRPLTPEFVRFRVLWRPTAQHPSGIVKECVGAVGELGTAGYAFVLRDGEGGRDTVRAADLKSWFDDSQVDFLPPDD